MNEKKIGDLKIEDFPDEFFDNLAELMENMEQILEFEDERWISKKTPKN
jgi:hypothetical protein